MLVSSLPSRSSIFDLNIKVAGLQVAVPVYDTDCDTSLTERLLSKYPELDRQRNKDKIKTKVLQSLRKIVKSHSVKPETRKKIAQFLDRCQIQVTICLKQNHSIQPSRIHSKRESLADLNSDANISISKQKSNNPKISSSKKFTKLYSITKEIFNQSKEIPAVKTKKESISRKLKQLSKSKYSNNKTKQTKQFEQQILTRIEQKLANYQKKQPKSNSNQEIMNLTTIADPRQQQSFFSFSEIPSIELADKNMKKNHADQRQDQSIVSLSNEKSRYRYGYDQIIAERQLSQRKPRQKQEGDTEAFRKKRASFNYIYDEQTRINSVQSNSNLRRNYFTHTVQLQKDEAVKSRPKYQYMQQYQPDRKQRNQKPRSKPRTSTSSNNYLRHKYDTHEETPVKKQALYSDF